MNGYNFSPYFDRYSGDTTHRKAGYTRLLAKPGLAEQASEFNEIQAIARDYTERLGNALFKDGDIISGCTMHINGTSVTIEAGKIFLAGLIRETEGATLAITGSGTERIVATVVTSIVTASMDSSLRDPAQGAENYGLEGADREKEVVVFSVAQGDSTSGGTVVYTIKDGEVPRAEVIVDNNVYVTDDILAERTYDENGSYKVNGIIIDSLLAAPQSTNNVSDKVKVTITEGKAYVGGYSITKPTSSSVFLRQSTTTRLQQSESHYYHSTEGSYELSNGPIAVVNNMTCLVSVVGEMHYGGSVRDSLEALHHTPVDKITRIYEKDSDGNVTRIYTESRDYTLYNDQISWAPTGSDSIEPANGTTYYVDYVYNKTMVRGTDYNIRNRADTAYVEFLEDGDKPDENSRFYISYTYTLARRDLILLKPDGGIKILEGRPDKMAHLITPYNGDDQLLALGYVDVFPTDALNNTILEGVGNVINFNSVRLTQGDFYTMLTRLENLEDRIMDLDMERELTGSEDTASLNGYFTDNFRNINKSDLGYRAEIDGDTVSYTACIDYDNEELTTAFKIDSADLVVKADEDNHYKILGTVISAPYEAELVLQQKYSTGTMLVNPYASYGPMCQVVISPDEDNWVDTETITVNNTSSGSSYSSSSVYSSTYMARGTHYTLSDGRDAYWVATGTVAYTTSSTSRSSYTTSSTRTTTSVASTVYEYMRQREVEVKGTAFGGNMTNIYCKFNDIPVDLIPMEDTATTAGADLEIDGVTVHTVNASEFGVVKAKFTVPAGVRCGTVAVTFTGTDGTGEEYTGTTNYSASGTLLTTTITNTTVYTTHYTVTTTHTNVLTNDPLAQSFVLSNEYDRTLIEMDLYFATKSSSRPAIIQIRNMVNGYPGDLVYAEVPVQPEDINIPTDPNVPVPTRIKLDQPVVCKRGQFYCFAVLSDSNAYSMYYAEMGKAVLGGSEDDIVSVNPYPTGVMFSSSNATTWTAHQGADLKFELYRSKYTGTGEIIFDEAVASEVSGIFVDVAYQDTANDGIEWYYRFKDSSGIYGEWLPVDTLTYRNLETLTDTVQLRANLSTNFTTSPFIDAERVSLRSFIGQKRATYISTHVTKDDFDEPYQALKVQYQVALPTGSSHKVYYMDTQGGNWIELKTGNNVTLETKKVTGEFTQYTWNVAKVAAMVADSTLEGVNFFKLRIELETTISYNRPRVRKLSAIFKFN